jgi:hypothetical protein
MTIDSRADRTATAQEDRIFIERCRICSAEYKFRFDSGEDVTIVCGIPKDHAYKAVSYVWEEVSSLVLECRHCSATVSVPMRDSHKFHHLMDFVRGGSTIWLDALSIDQDDDQDKAHQLPNMGTIFREAATVSVFLPALDKEAYDRLRQLGITADAIVKRHKDYGMLAEEHARISTADLETLGKLADDFSEQIIEWARNVHKWKYWRRAWTLQEWAMASEIEISYEAAPGNEKLVNIKNVIVLAATAMCRWKQITAKRSENTYEQVKARNESGRINHIVRLHFTFEDFPLEDHYENVEDVRRVTFMPAVPSATSSGTYVRAKHLSSELIQLRYDLSQALHTMSVSQREASDEADLVHCWAAMCNLTYDYDRRDKYATALHKVIHALRQRGVRIFNFLANTNCGETDLDFLEYAAAHRQTNDPIGGFLSGSPIFTGRADTVIHVQKSLSAKAEIAFLEPKFDVKLRLIDRYIIKRPISWGSKEKARSAFRSLVSGKADGETLLDVVSLVETAVNEISPDILNQHLLVQIQIGVDDYNSMWYFNAWAVIPATTPLQELFVAREDLNGTLVLAIFAGPIVMKDEKRQPSSQARIVSYLHMTHQRDGTYLVKTDEVGTVDIVFRTKDTPQPELFWLPEGIESSMAPPSLPPESHLLSDLSDRVFGMKIKLGERTLPLMNSSGNERPKI